MRFRKPQEQPWGRPVAQCVLVVRCLEAPSDLASPEGWRVVTEEAANRSVPPGGSGEANERFAAAKVELVAHMWHETEPVAPVVQSGMTWADSAAAQGEGVILDPFAQRLVMPGDWQVQDKVYDIDPREHVTVQIVSEPSGLWVHTHGLLKFGRPEVELFDVPAELEKVARAFVLDTAGYVIDGPVIAPGSTLGSPDKPLRVVEGARQAAHWDSIPVVEFRGVGASTAEALRAWAA